LKAIFDKRDPPAHENRDPQRRVLVFEMPIPGNGHKDVGDGQQDNRAHSPSCLLIAESIRLTLQVTSLFLQLEEMDITKG
jgi:hypothetical protein